MAKTLLEAAMQPASLADLRRHYDEQTCLVLEGAANKFENLVTLEQIERRLNDGCNASFFPQTIKQGARKALVDSACAWTPASLAKTEFAVEFAAGNSFMLPNSSQISRGLSRICDDIENFFAADSVHADVHLYVSPSASSSSYYAHRDLPQHKILLQAIGSTDWQLFEAKEELAPTMTSIAPDQQEQYLNVVSEFTLSQGDLLYMPPGTFHRVTKVGGPRVSVSIPFYSMASANRMDRSHIPFQQIFERGLNSV